MFVNAHVYPVAMVIVMFITAIANAAVLRSGWFGEYAGFARLVGFEHSFVEWVKFTEFERMRF